MSTAPQPVKEAAQARIQQLLLATGDLATNAATGPEPVPPEPVPARPPATSSTAAGGYTSSTGRGGSTPGGGGTSWRCSTPLDLTQLMCGPVVVDAALVPCRNPFTPAAGPIKAASSSSSSITGPLTSVVTGLPIRGAYVVLEDGTSCVSKSEAVMLARVLRFSPLGSGQLLTVT
jgi:hypothetical protein